MKINNLAQLKKNLLDLGAKENDLDNIIKDVDQIIMSKILALYEQNLSEEQKVSLKSISAENLLKYIKDNKETMPTLSKEDLEKITKETWNDYFAALKRV